MPEGVFPVRIAVTVRRQQLMGPNWLNWEGRISWLIVAFQRSEDETEIRDTESAGGEGHQGHPPRDPQAVFCGGEESASCLRACAARSRSPRFAGRERGGGERGEDRREPLLQLVERSFLEAGKKRLAGDTARAATSDEVKQLRRQARDLKEVVAEQALGAADSQKKA